MRVSYEPIRCSGCGHFFEDYRGSNGKCDSCKDQLSGPRRKKHAVKRKRKPIPGTKGVKT